MEPFSLHPRRHNRRAWFEHPMLIRFLPYSLRTHSCVRDMPALRTLFEANHKPWRQVAGQGLLITVQRRYEVVWSGDQLQIHGPYGQKAWTMVTLVTAEPDEYGTMLTLRTAPHPHIVRGMLVQVVCISLCAFAVGVPGAPWFPLIFFGPFLYIATVIAAKVEAAGIETLVRQVVEEQVHPTA